MKVFVAGATGAIGRALIPQLVARGHEVVGMTRTASKQDGLRALGARPVVADALDPDAVAQAVASAEPEVIVHQLTALSGKMSIRDARHPDRSSMAKMTNRLRTEATDHLLAAGRAVGARRFVAQSITGFRFARTGGPVQTEDDPFDPNPPATLRMGQAAIRHLEEAVTGAADLEGVVLRYGPFYGPGTALGPGGSIFEDVRRRRVPVVGHGGGVWSFVHIDDVASATAAALERGAPGIYNVVDDEPATVAEWLPALAEAIGAPAPRHVPAFAARLVAGAHGVAMMTEIRGAKNAKARRELGWQPYHPSWREGFRTALG